MQAKAPRPGPTGLGPQTRAPRASRPKPLGQGLRAKAKATRLRLPCQQITKEGGWTSKICPPFYRTPSHFGRWPPYNLKEKEKQGRGTANHILSLDNCLSYFTINCKKMLLDIYQTNSFSLSGSRDNKNDHKRISMAILLSWCSSSDERAETTKSWNFGQEKHSNYFSIGNWWHFAISAFYVPLCFPSPIPSFHQHHNSNLASITWTYWSKKHPQHKRIWKNIGWLSRPKLFW